MADLLESSDKSAVLEIRNLEISTTTHNENNQPIKIVLVDGISLSLERGKVVGLIGESGAGKSTIGLASMAYGRGGVRITGGEVWLNGRDILQLPEKRRREVRGIEVCYVAQSAAAAFNPAKRLMDQVIEAAVRRRKIGRVLAEQRARDLFSKLSLPNPDTIGERYPHQVSGGQLQRIMTAMALCSEPDLIVFDEPTTALDVTTQLDVLAAIKEAINDTGVAAIYITHDLAVVAQIADDIMVLRHGKLVEFGSVEQIIERPAETYTKALLSVRKNRTEEKPAAGRPVLSVYNVSASYQKGIPVLNDISIDLLPGETLALVGESGSGKSTLARAIAGLLVPDSGSVLFEGKELAASYRERTLANLRGLQMIYQMADTAMNPRQKVGSIISRPLQFYAHLQGRELQARVFDLLDKMELNRNLADRYPSELSGGQKQRVCIARALAADPKVIICDEVTSALDPLVTEGILSLLLNLQKEDGVSYLFVTHDLATVEAIADKVAVMHHGKVVRYGSKSEVLAPPYDPYTERLLKSVPKMEIGWLERASSTTG